MVDYHNMYLLSLSLVCSTVEVPLVLLKLSSNVNFDWLVSNPHCEGSRRLNNLKYENRIKTFPFLQFTWLTKFTTNQSLSQTVCRWNKRTVGPDLVVHPLQCHDSTLFHYIFWMPAMIVRVNWPEIRTWPRHRLWTPWAPGLDRAALHRFHRFSDRHLEMPVHMLLKGKEYNY